jgi:hypothetical protein
MEVPETITTGNLEFRKIRSELLRKMLMVDPTMRMGLEELKGDAVFEAATSGCGLNVDLPGIQEIGSVGHITVNACDGRHTFLCDGSISCPLLFDNCCVVTE